MPEHSSHRHRRASEDLRPRDQMPRPSRLPARSATVIDRSSRGRRVYDGDDDDDEDDRSRSRSKSRPRLRPRSSSESSRHSESDVLEPLPRPAQRRQRALRPKKVPRSSSSSSSADLTPSASSPDERPKRRAAKRQIEVMSESEPEPAEHRRLPRRRQKEIAYAGASDNDGVYEDPLPRRARASRSQSRPRYGPRSGSRSSSRKPHHRDHRDEGKHISSSKRTSEPPKRNYESEPYYDKSEHSPPQKASSSRVTSSHSLGSSSKRSSALEALFSPRRQPSSEKPAKIVECVACRDEVSSNKAPKLKCGHRMCNPCLRRKFRLSIQDPSQMPPKCCTADRISLKHVQDLFPDKFKNAWNQKFNEFSTRDPIYCPRRKCGEWIKPERIYERNGRNRCGAEFCMMCGAKWKSCECPWFNNDTAEQDRLDSLQVPSPIIDRDRFGGGDSLSPRDCRTGRGVVSGARSRQPTYEDDVYSRRLQVQEDEDYARRLQYEEPEDDYENGYDDVISLGHAAGHFMKERNYRHRSQSLVQPAAVPLATFERTNSAADYVAGVNRARGVRGSSIDRLADRFSEQRQGGSSPMHRPFGNPLPPPALPPLTMSPPSPSHAPPAIPLMRSQTMDDEMFSSPRSIRGSERIILRRATHDYADEVDMHALASRRRFREPEPPKDSVLAGFTGPGRGMNRVFEWSKHVEPGLPDNHTVIAT
ncbi:hypothetical protein DL766_001076 [Monosporascus sp. MC13-8B]|nr:hypothetical protein DL763_002053 [Monosporascus cannonballus]RYP38281.1 hypothetical protein DL766_001076 [Monosporascus sp. MC13-8B]